MISNISNKSKFNINNLKKIILRKLSNCALNYEDYPPTLSEIKYNNQLKYFYETKEKFYNKKCLKHIIVNDLGSKCHICKATGWVTNNKILKYNNKNNNNNNNSTYTSNFEYSLCILCNGTGFN